MNVFFMKKFELPLNCLALTYIVRLHNGNLLLTSFNICVTGCLGFFAGGSAFL